jgi:ATP-dependent helicase HrpB
VTSAGQGLTPTGLPVEDVIADLRSALAGGTAVLTAEAGAGKTTVVPLRLLDEDWLEDRKIVVLEPRRVAARAAATRMSALLGEDVGTTVGYATRDERRTGKATRIEVVTEGILTRRLQSDPSLPGVGMVVFDEFHERHLQTDLGLALTLDAHEALRPDLRVMAMSATIATAPIANLLGGAPVVISAGHTFPVEIRWTPLRPGGRLTVGVAGAVRAALDGDRGDVLVFLPGMAEIRAVTAALGDPDGVEVLPLHGGLPAGEQDRALRAGRRRRVVVATDLAETSVTVEGVRVVVDAGLARRPFYDPASGLTRLRTMVASRASADQRAGRAGRLGPGVAYRLWSESEHATRRPWPDPEIVSIDVAGLALELAVWGAAPGELKWLNPPPAAALETAKEVLEQLGATDNGRPTALGRRLSALPLHPRLGAMLLAAPAPARRTAGLLAALLSERDIFRRDGLSTTADVASRLAVLRGKGPAPAHVDRAALTTVRRRAEELVRRAGRPADHQEDVDPGPLLAAAYPDRMAQARGSRRYRLRHGGGAVLADHDPLAGTAWLVAANIDGGEGVPGRADGQIRLAAPLDRGDVERIGGHAIRRVVRLEWDEASDDLRAVTERTLDALVLDTTRGTARPGPDTTAALVARAIDTGLSVLGWTASTRALQARVGWARRAFGESWPDVSDQALAGRADGWLADVLNQATSRADLARIEPSGAIRAALGSRAHELNRMVPTTFQLAGGRRLPIDYGGDQPRISAPAQDLYGTTIHPTIAGGRIPLTVEVLSPARRPVQITADLPSFWRGSWQQVRKEMAGRYPKHAWPDDPSTTPPPKRARPGVDPPH